MCVLHCAWPRVLALDGPETHLLLAVCRTTSEQEEGRRCTDDVLQLLGQHPGKQSADVSSSGGHSGGLRPSVKTIVSALQVRRCQLLLLAAPGAWFAAVLCRKPQACLPRCATVPASHCAKTALRTNQACAG